MRAIVIAAISFILATEARADRYLERFIDYREAKDDYVRLAATLYAHRAESERFAAKHPLADYLAGRAFGFIKSGLIPNINPNLFAELPQNSKGDILRKISTRLQSAGSCLQESLTDHKYIELYLTFDVAAYELASNPSSEPLVEGLMDDVQVFATERDCGDLAYVGDRSMGVDWDLWTDKLQYQWNERFVGGRYEEPLHGGLGGAEIWYADNRRSYNFGRSANPFGRSIQPCVVDGRQASLYYDIDETGHTGGASSLNLKLVVQRIADASAVIIEGHSDSGGPGWRNLELARDRAIRVARELSDLGIAPSDLYIIVLGAHCPQVSVGPDTYAPPNRRVVIRYLP